MFHYVKVLDNINLKKKRIDHDYTNFSCAAPLPHLSLIYYLLLVQCSPPSYTLSVATSDIKVFFSYFKVLLSLLKFVKYLYTLSTAVFLRHKCQFSFCVREIISISDNFRIKCVSNSKISGMLCFLYFLLSTVKPLIKNTSKEFIKCRILHFLIIECCRYLVF